MSEQANEDILALNPPVEVDTSFAAVVAALAPNLSLARRLAKEAIRTQLLLQLLDSRLLEVKELELRLELTDSTLAELAESRVFRETGQLALTSGPEARRRTWISCWGCRVLGHRPEVRGDLHGHRDQLAPHTEPCAGGGAVPKYFEYVQRHPRTLVGEQVPSMTGDGMEVLRISRRREGLAGRREGAARARSPRPRPAAGWRMTAGRWT